LSLSNSNQVPQQKQLIPKLNIFDPNNAPLQNQQKVILNFKQQSQDFFQTLGQNRQLANTRNIDQIVLMADSSDPGKEMTAEGRDEGKESPLDDNYHAISTTARLDGRDNQSNNGKKNTLIRIKNVQRH
jgi:hypothetical protein